MTPKVIAGSVIEPVTLEETRAHLEAASYGDSDTDPSDDAMIEAWISAAREHCENFLGLKLATRTLEIALDSFPTTAPLGIELPMGPVREVISIMAPAEANYTSDDVDSDAAAEIEIYADGQVNPAVYVLDDYVSPAVLKPTGTAWPTITAATNAIKIRYVAGYGVDSDGGEALPAVIRAAILLMVGHFYANREDTGPNTLASIPNGVEALLRPLRIRLGMA